MAKNTSEQKVILRQTRSATGHPERQRGTLRGLGLGRIGKTAEHTLTPSVLGMVRAISHLIEIDRVDGK